MTTEANPITAAMEALDRGERLNLRNPTTGTPFAVEKNPAGTPPYTVRVDGVAITAGSLLDKPSTLSTWLETLDVVSSEPALIG